MPYFEISQRPDRHKDLLDAAEALGSSALIHFERGGIENIHLGNQMALGIKPVEGGDIGWQIVDVAIILTRHKDVLDNTTADHLRTLLEASLHAWSDREFGRGNVNHPVIATWLYAAAGSVLGKLEYSRIADRNMYRFLHIFSQAGDMSEYNSPTYLGPALVGLACIGQYAEMESTRLRARLIEERIWLSLMVRWHAPSQQLAGPHSRAYADSTLGFGGIVRYLAHAVLTGPVFWDNDLALTYDHNYDAEWAARIAACVFCFPDYLRGIGEQKHFPYDVYSSTDGEDYTVDGREVYRGGWGRLTTYMTADTCLGSSERPYVDAGQSEMCIAYWKRKTDVRQFTDMRAVYFRYVANDRLPGQANKYYSWYGGAERYYSPNLLHQDGRQHVLQQGGKAILLSQPLKRENGKIYSLRFDTLIPIYAPLDEIWLGERQVKDFPLQSGWEEPLLIRDGPVYLAFLPLQPTNLGDAVPALELAEANHHLILSIYNLRGEEQRSFPAYVLDNTHNGLVFEIGTADEYGDFKTFRDHIAAARVHEELHLGAIRDVRYQSGSDTLHFVYQPETQETLLFERNVQGEIRHGFVCPDAVQGDGGELSIGDIKLVTAPGAPAWLAHKAGSDWITAVLPVDQPSAVQLVTPVGTVEFASFAAGRIRIHIGEMVDITVDCVAECAPAILTGFEKLGVVTISGRKACLKKNLASNIWELL